MTAALKLDPVAQATEKLSQKPPLGEKWPKLRLVWDNPKLSTGTQKEKPKVKPDASYGRGLYNYFRYYDPNTGRYITSDPIGLRGGINTYSYALNNPLYWIDPDGLNAAVGVGVSVGLCARFPRACGAAAGTVICAITGMCNESQDDAVDETSSQCPAGSKPINETDWSGDHQDIKAGIGAGPADSTKIDPSGNVWGENPDGSWTNYGPAGDYTGSGVPSGRKGKDRRRRY